MTDQPALSLAPQTVGAAALSAKIIASASVTMAERASQASHDR
jgi:hypothetical protein